MTFVLLITTFLIVIFVSDLDSQLKQLYYTLSINGFFHWILKRSLLQSHKAFDSAPYKPLLDFIYSLDFPFLLLSWLHSYLQGHIQQVIINGFLSFKSQIASGVSQGPILWPLLFIIYINDIAKLYPSSLQPPSSFMKFFNLKKFLLQLQCPLFNPTSSISSYC